MTNLISKVRVRKIECSRNWFEPVVELLYGEGEEATPLAPLPKEVAAQLEIISDPEVNRLRNALFDAMDRAANERLFGPSATLIRRQV